MGQLVEIGRALRVDQLGHLGIGRDEIREDRDQLVPDAHHLAIAHVEVHAGNEFPVRARCDDMRLPHQHRLGQRVMGMAREDHVDPFDDPGHLFVDVKTIVAQANDEFSALSADLIHHLLHMFIADAKGVFREHPTGVGDGHVRKRLPDHGDLHAAALKEFVGFEQFGRLIPFAVKDVLAKGGKGQPLDNLLHPFGAQRKLPMEGHRVGLQRVHHVDHVLTLGLETGHRAVPRIPAIEQQRIWTVGADRVQHGGHTVEAADLAVSLRMGDEIIVGQRVIQRCAAADAVADAEILTSDMRHLATIIAHADVDRWLAEIDRFQLRVDVGHMHQGDIAELLEFQKRVLIEAVLRRQPRPVAEARAAVDGGRSHGHLQKITARQHVTLQHLKTGKGPAPG